jgi:hypothetical protein
VHVPQLTVPPQPLGTVPQVKPAGQALRGVQPHWLGLLGVPPPHVCGAVHVPQLTVPPQPSGTVPQVSPAGQTFSAVQPHWWGLLGVPPPHVCGAVQVPQLTMPPQPSGTVPQVSPAGQVVVMGVQPTQMSSCDGVADCWHVPPPRQVLLAVVHCSHPPKSTLLLVVSQTDVAPLQARPSSPQEHGRQLLTVVPEQIG